MENNNMLAKVSLGINAILIIAVVVLFVKMPGSGSAGDIADDSTSVDIQNDGEMTIAYYNGDSLNTTDFVLEIQTQMEGVQMKGEQKLASTQKEIENWQAKWAERSQTGLLEREQEQYYKEAAEMEQKMAYAQQSAQMEAAQETELLMMTLYTRIQTYAKSFAQKNNIDLMLQFQLGNNISYVAPHMDVTKEFMNHVNAEYNSTFSADEESEEVEAE